MTCLNPSRRDRALLAVSSSDLEGLKGFSLHFLAKGFFCGGNKWDSASVAVRDTDGFNVAFEFNGSEAEAGVGTWHAWVECPKQTVTIDRQDWDIAHPQVLVKDLPENSSGFIELRSWRISASV